VTEDRRKYSRGSVVTTSDWQPVYAALIMILLVFFIMLLSHARFGEGNMRKLQKAVLGKQGKKEAPAVAGGQETLGSLRSALSNAGLSNQDVGIVKDGAGMRLTIKGLIFYESGGSMLLPKAEFILREVLRHAGKYGSRIEVYIGAECRPAGDGLIKPDWELATLRSLNVQRYLSRENGFPADRLETAARGISCSDRGDGRDGATGNVTILIDR